MLNKKQIYGDAILLFTSLIWGVGYAVIAIGLRAGVGELFLTTSRFIIATIAMLPFVYKKFNAINKSVIIKGIALGLLLVLGFIAQTIGQKDTTTTNVAFLTSVNIVLIPFTSFVVIKKKINLRSIIAALITMLGIAFLTLGNSFNINIGDYYVLLCALFFAFYASVTDLSAKKEEPILLVFIQFLTAAIFAGAFLIYSKEQIVLNPTIIATIIYSGVLSNFVATLLYTYGLKYTSAERASIILSLESIFGTILGIILFGENFSYKLVIGSVLILFAILYSERIILKKY